MEGCVYIISNKSLPTLKIGRTTEHAEKRAKQLNNSAISYRFVPEYELRVKYNHEELEKKVHRLLASKWDGGDSKECFECDIEYAINAIRNAAKDFNITNEVFYWVERAKENAQYENPDAQTELGYAYYKGYGVSQDYKQAKKWFEKAAHQANAKAQNYLGLIYQNKLGLDIKNDDNSEDIFSNQIEQHDLIDTNIIDEYAEIAKDWFEKAAEQNNADAQFHLACIYCNSPLLENSYQQAFELFEKSANQGHVKTQLHLGKMYQNGKGIKRDLKKAENWYLKAVETDNRILNKVIQSCLK